MRARHHVIDEGAEQRAEADPCPCPPDEFARLPADLTFSLKRDRVLFLDGGSVATGLVDEKHQALLNVCRWRQLVEWLRPLTNLHPGFRRHRWAHRWEPGPWR